MNKTIYAAISLLLIGIASIVPWADAQQKPNPVIIWCQDPSGNYAPCLAGNSLDYDTGGGTVNQGTVGIALPGSGGPVAGGTSTNPIRTDPTGTTTQPVSGTVTANVGTTNGLHLDSTFTGRFPAAFSSADNISAQTATAIHGLLYGWDSGGSNWDRVQITSGALNVSVQNSTLAVTQSGTWTLQPGNTANTTAWLFKLDQTSTNNDVDVASLPANASVNLNQLGGSSIQASSNGLNTAGTGLSASSMVGQCDDTSPTSLTENQFGHARINCTTHEQLVTATQSGNWSVRNQDGSGNSLTSASRGSERALSVQIVDGSGAQVTSFGGSGGTASNFGSAFPSAGTAAGLSDGTNMQAGRAIDADTGGGTVYVQGINLLKRASGGPVEAGTSSDPLRVDPTGTTTQPVSGNVGIVPVTSGGTTPCYLTSAASTNSTSCKGSAGQLYGFDLVNTTTTIYYLRIYNSSSAPTCSSATGFVRTIPIPPAAAAGGAGGIARSIVGGEAYGTGLGFCLTGGGSSTDNTSAAAGVYVTLNYK